MNGMFLILIPAVASTGMWAMSEEPGSFKAHAHAFIKEITHQEPLFPVFAAYRATLISILAQEKDGASNPCTQKLCRFLNTCPLSSFITLISRSIQDATKDPSDWLIMWINQKDAEKRAPQLSKNP